MQKTQFPLYSLNSKCAGQRQKAPKKRDMIHILKTPICPIWLLAAIFTMLACLSRCRKAPKSTKYKKVSKLTCTGEEVYNVGLHISLLASSNPRQADRKTGRTLFSTVAPDWCHMIRMIMVIMRIRGASKRNEN